METNAEHYGESARTRLAGFDAECSRLPCRECRFLHMPCYQSWLAMPYGHSLRVDAPPPEPDPNPL